MARLTQEHKEEHLSYLRELVNNKFGQYIRNAGDCERLGADISVVTGEQLSVDTLRRLFKVLRTNSQPSIYTLDVCSRYVGYSGWQEAMAAYSGQNTLYLKTLLLDMAENEMSFDELRKRIETFSKSKELYEIFGQIMLLKYQKEDKLFFEKLFDIQYLFDYSDDYKYEIYHTVHVLGMLCSKSLWLSEIAVKNYFNLPYQFDYFIEWLVVPQYDYYLLLLDNYYAVKKDDKSAAVFYHIIKGTHHAETGRWELFGEHFQQLGEILKGDSDIESNILAMRYLGMQICHESRQRDSKLYHKLLDKVFKNKYINEKDAGHRVSSIFILCQYLFCVGAYESIIRLYEEKSRQHSSVLGYWAEMNFNQLKVFYAHALMKTGRRTDAQEIFNSININKFDLNFKSKMVAIYDELERELKL